MELNLTAVAVLARLESAGFDRGTVAVIEPVALLSAQSGRASSRIPDTRRG